MTILARATAVAALLAAAGAPVALAGDACNSACERRVKAPRPRTLYVRPASVVAISPPKDLHQDEEE